MTLRSGTAILLTLLQVTLSAQQPQQQQPPQQQVPPVVLPPGFVRAPAQSGPANPAKPLQLPQQQQPAPAQQPPPAQPGATAAKPQAPPVEMPKLEPTPTGGLTLQNASLREVIDILAQRLKINYILDPRVNGAVTINTYGETKNIDNRTLLDTILRINNAAMIQVGDIYRIVPLADVQRLPLPPDVNGRPLVEDDRTMLNLLFLKYATVDELAKLLDQFLGEGGKMWSYAPANLLMIQDSRRNMKRLLELVSLFDDAAFTDQRVRLFEIKNGKPSDVAKELDSILKSISLNEKSSPVKLLPVDRINTLIAVAPNPGVFKEVETWLSKLDIEVESSAGTISNFVYRVRYGFAPMLAMAIMGLYSNDPMYAMMMMGGGIGMGGGMGMGMGGGMGMGMGGGMGGMYGGGMGGMYGGGMGGGMYGGGYGQVIGGGFGGGGAPMGGPQAAAVGPGGRPVVPGQDQTGSYLSPTAPGRQGQSGPRVVPNPFDNSLLIQGTRSEYESILKLLRDIDIPPRQVLVEAKIYEVNLTGELSNGLAVFLNRRSSTPRPPGSPVTGSLADGSLALSASTLVGQSRELLAFLQTQEFNTKARVISAPSVVATDSIPASINVGQEVPTLSAQAVTGAQQGGTSLFANSVQNRNSGITLNVLARVNPMGVVTMTVNQEVSAPIAPDPNAAIQSPSFSKRTVSTQLTVQDGDTIAIGGIINEDNGSSSVGIPYLHRIPILGFVFGNKAFTNRRTELIIFLTPKVIYDMNNMNEATEELKSGLKKLSKYVKNE